MGFLHRDGRLRGLVVLGRSEKLRGGQNGRLEWEVEIVIEKESQLIFLICTGVA
jgi:hypothetical protein